MKFHGFMVAAGFAIALVALMSSCSSGGNGGDGDKKGKITFNGAPSGDGIVTIVDYSGNVRNSDDLYEFTMANAINNLTIGYSTQASLQSPVSLLTPAGETFTRSGTFVVAVVVGTTSRYYDKVSFSNGSATIDWNSSYFNGLTYVTGGGSSSSGGGGGGSSSSHEVTMGYGTCRVSDVDGFSGVWGCAEYKNVDTSEQRYLCEEEGEGVWSSNACPSGEKVTCIDEEEDDEVYYKFYADDATCEDGLKDINGEETGVTKGNGSCRVSDVEGFSGLVACDEHINVDTSKQRDLCEEDDEGVWSSDLCPSGEKLTCINEEDKEEAYYKVYVDGFACSDFGLTNIDGDEPDVSMGGACGLDDIGYGIQTCVSYPTMTTAAVEVGCNNIDVPFIEACPGGADVVCDDSDMVIYLYGEAAIGIPCDLFSKSMSPQAQRPNLSKLLRSRLLE